MYQIKTGFLKEKEKPEYTCNIYAENEELPAFSVMEELESKCDVDFFCKEENGNLKFIHVADIGKSSFIYTNGLKITSGYIPDLGEGIYCIEDSDTNINALDNLKAYFECYNQDSPFLEVRGTYTGKYIKCIYGNSHEGYIVLTDVNKIKIESIEEKSLCTIFKKLYEFH